MKGYYTEEALVLAIESRTSSPVRIPRDETTLMHPQVEQLLPLLGRRRICRRYRVRGP